MLLISEIGERIMIIKLQNDKIKAEIKSEGAELISLRQINDSTEYIWQGDKSVWGRSAPVLFPIVGKLKNNTYTYQGDNYHLSQHGFARDMFFEIFEKSDDCVIYRLKSDESTLEKFPFEFEFYIAYVLKGNTLSIEYKIVNVDSKDMFFSIGAHPGFYCPLDGNGTIENCYLEFEVPEKSGTYLVEEGYISEHKVSFLNNEKIVKLSKELFAKDAIILEDLNSKSVSIKNTKSDKFITMTFDEFKYLGIWTKPEGAPFICLEPWNGIGDSKNSNGKIEDKKDIKSLSPNLSYKCGFCISIGI